MASYAALLLTTPGTPQAEAREGPSTGVAAALPHPQPPGDLIAGVGDYTITFGEINTALNSPAVVGGPSLRSGRQSAAPCGSCCSTGLSARASSTWTGACKGSTRDSADRRELERFDNAMLAGHSR
jgi:hypothetical protein